MSNHVYDLEQLARQAMFNRGLFPDFSRPALDQLDHIQFPAEPPHKAKDLRHLLWCSIDNDDSRDLDQLTYAEKESDQHASLWVAIADVDALVKQQTPIDQRAQINTTSVYTPAKIFPMLPEKLSTNLTSLNETQERVAIVVKVVVARDGEIMEYSIFPAVVYNRAKLTYNSVGPWLEGKQPVPPKVDTVPDLRENLQLQQQITQALKRQRHQMGALSLETIEPVPVWQEATLVGMKSATHNAAHELIEHFMIASNQAMALTFKQAQIPSLRRVVRVPKDWDRIVALAAELGETLPLSPDSKALDQFLIRRQAKDPDSFPDLSLAVIKLLGSGEYIVEKPGQAPVGHFGLALRNYTHSTAPNRRFPDLITQRQFKAFFHGGTNPYPLSELELLAQHCTQQEDAATKVERQMRKSAAAVLLSSHMGEKYRGIVTGAASKGIWVRIFDPPVEGCVVKGGEKLSVGQRVQVRLVSIDIPRGFIDFVVD